jgi:cystathionine beta-lyase
MSVSDGGEDVEDIELTIDFLRSRRNSKWSRYGPDAIPAWVADMDFRAAPAIQAAIRRLVEEEDYGYPDRAGEVAERAVAIAFSRHERELYGWDPDPDLVLPLSDLIQGMFATIIAFTEPSDGVLLQIPAYTPFFAAIDGTGRRLLANPMRDNGRQWVLDLEQLKASAPGAQMLMVCNPHNPTGRAFDRDELAALGRIALEHDLILVSDEIHSELIYPGRAHVPMAMVSSEIAAKTVTITSATKSFNIAGLRCAVIHFGSAELRDRFRQRIPERLLGQLSVFGVDATLAAWRNGGPWLDGVLARLARNRVRLGKFLAERLPAVGYREPEATYLAWLDLAGYDLKPSPAEFLFNVAHVRTSAGSEFGADYGEFARLNFATSEAILEEILMRMAVAIEGRHGA